MLQAYLHRGITFALHTVQLYHDVSISLIDFRLLDKILIEKASSIKHFVLLFNYFDIF